MKKIDKMKRAMQSLMHSIDDKNDTIFKLRMQHAEEAQEIERLRDVVRERNNALNGKDDTIHNLRRALHKRDLSVDNLRAQVNNLQEKAHATPMSPVMRSIRSKAARAEQRNSLIEFIMRDTALMMKEGYCEHIGLAELHDELKTMTMEELNTQLKASIISAGCR